LMLGIIGRSTGERVKRADRRAIQQVGNQEHHRPFAAPGSGAALCKSTDKSVCATRILP
jgi:hypothetical protein